MTKETNGTAPDLILLGSDDEGKPRAARFPAGQARPTSWPRLPRP